MYVETFAYENRHTNTHTYTVKPMSFKNSTIAVTIRSVTLTYFLQIL